MRYHGIAKLAEQWIHESPLILKNLLVILLKHHANNLNTFWSCNGLSDFLHAVFQTSHKNICTAAIHSLAGMVSSHRTLNRRSMRKGLKQRFNGEICPIGEQRNGICLHSCSYDNMFYVKKLTSDMRDFTANSVEIQSNGVCFSSGFHAACKMDSKLQKWW